MKHFLDTFQKLDAGNLDLLTEIYAADIRFIDPAHEIRGLDRLTDYFAALYKNVTAIRFDFHHALSSGNEAWVQWEMAFSHPRIKRGKTVTVSGASHLEFDAAGKVFLHRDYFDLGAMLYEHLPLLGGVITALKRRLGS